MQNSQAQKTALAGLAGLAVAMGIGRFVYTPLLPAMMSGLGLTASQAGWIASANFVGYLLGAILAGGGWARGRERQIALFSLAASTLLVFAMAALSSFWPLLLVRFLAGIASAFCLIFLLTTVMGRLASLGREDLQAVLFGGVGTGIALSSLVTAGMYLSHASWRWGWIGSGVLSISGLLIVMLLLAPAPASKGPVGHEPSLPRDRSFWAMTTAYGLFGAGYVVTATFLVAIVRDGAGGPLMEASVWLLTGLAAVPSVYLWNRYASRVGVTVAFALACLLEMAGVAASVLIPGTAGPLIGGFLLGATFMAITTFGLVAGRAWAPASPRKVVSVMTAFFGTGQMLAPLAAGYVADWTQSFLLPSLGAALLLLAAATLGWWAGRDRPMILAARKPVENAVP